jgi:cytochrome c-type biogenesis protein CcmH
VTRAVTRGARALALALTCGLLWSALALTPAQESRAERLGKNLRCPICIGLPITESTNDLSVQMLREVGEQVAAGRSDREVYAYFAARYGNFVLLDPPKVGTNLLLWSAPLLALAAGGAVLLRFLRRRRPAAEAAALASAPGAEQVFDPYLAEVRRQTRRDGDTP